MTQQGAGEFTFKAEVRQLLDILVHSLYTNREIFLRELVSNASDALDKLRFEQSRGAEVADPDLPLEIRIEADKDKKELTIADTGLGMTRDEIVENIGTIAHSGTADFVKAASQGQEKNALESFIGRFGVGFYSVFMVAREVELVTRSHKPGEPAWRWTSDGLGSYRIEPVEGDVKRGTTITVRLKDETDKFADADTLRDVIRRHSNFVTFPILVAGERANTVTALWREPRSSVTPEQYAEFYKFLSHDIDDPLHTIHTSVDAPVQFSALLFVPKKNYDLFGMGQERKGPDLYVRRVLIQKDNQDLLPEYLGFLRGVVDSEDLPLNISRETLQENVLLRKISQTLVKQVYSELERMAGDKDKYAQFWHEHGKIFKFGYSDYLQRDRYAELLRFNSSASEDKDGLVSLAEYAGRMREGQKEIYYAAGPSREALLRNPHLEMFRRKGLEVLYLFEPVDEFAMDALGKYKDFELKAAEHADPAVIEAFPDAEDTAKPDVPEITDEEVAAFPDFLKRLKDILGERVTEVRESRRLKDSPACLVTPSEHMTASMQKIMRAMTKDTSVPQKIMEINRDHPLTRNLLAVFRADAQDDYLRLAAEQLYEAALLQEGYLQDPHALVGRIQDHLTRASGWYKDRLAK